MKNKIISINELLKFIEDFRSECLKLNLDIGEILDHNTIQVDIYGTVSRGHWNLKDAGEDTPTIFLNFELESGVLDLCFDKKYSYRCPTSHKLIGIPFQDLITNPTKITSLVEVIHSQYLHIRQFSPKLNTF